MSLPIAIQVYSVRNEANADARGTLQQIKDMGYEGVEFAGFCNETPADLKKICEEVGLVPISGHISMDAVLDIEKTIADYSTLGVKYLALAWLAAERRPGAELWEETRQAIITFATAAKKAGITFCYHNHDFEFEKIDGKYKLDIMYEEIPADLLQTELDTCWVNVGGENPADYVRKYAGRAPLVHLKDFVGSKSENMYELIGDDKAKAEAKNTFGLRYVGQGKQDFPSIIKAAEESGTEWLIVEQDSPSPDMTPMECAKKSREYLKSIGY